MAYTVSNQSLAVIEKFKQDRTAATIPTSLATYLYIYTHSFSECYTNYMEGANALAKYLAPIDIKIVSYPVPDILCSYELTELARVLRPQATIPLSTIQIENAIYEHLTKSR